MSSPLPGPHPDPPDLSRLALPLAVVETPWFRHHKSEFGPVFFGRTGECRFDAPPPPDGQARPFGVLYLAGDPHCAFIETFGHSHVKSGARGRMVTTQALEKKRLARLTFPRPLRLVDLRDHGLARIGADLRLCAGDYGPAQRWSAALWAHPEAPDGVLYRARHDPGRSCAALYDRAGEGIVAADLGTLADPGHVPLLADLLKTYGFGLF